MAKAHVTAHFYGGGLLDGLSLNIPLDDGSLPAEYHIPMPASQVAPTADPLHAGAYTLNSARSGYVPEGFPDDIEWIDARYRWRGEADL